MSQNIFKIYDGRTNFWQWDTGQHLVILNDLITEVHLSHKGVKSSRELEIKDENGMRVCDIPDVFLQIPKNLVVYVMRGTRDSEYTITSVEIAVKPRPQPDGYMSVHDDEYDDIDGRLDVIELTLADECLYKSDLDECVNDVIAQVKESGEFKGEKGDKGDPGVPGLPGDAGADGKDGVGITKAEINDEGELVITLSDNSVNNLGIVVGAKGEKGDKGDPGNDGPPGKDATIEYPVNSVNGKTGAITLTASDVGALPVDTEIPSVEGFATEVYVNSAVAQKSQVQIITWEDDD